MGPAPRFDHEKARELRAEGWTYVALANRFGVTPEAVRRVCIPEVAARMARAANKWAHNNRRAPCLGGCGRLVWTLNPDRTGYCVACLGALRTGPNVCDGELRCTTCDEWKPDSDFPANGPAGRRGRRHECRSCSTKRRREHRAANRERDRAYQREYKRTRRTA